MSLLREWRWALPALVLVGLLTIWPLGVSLWSSLFRSSATVPSDKDFVALGNYGSLVTDSDWWGSLFAALLLTTAVVVTQLVLGIVFAASLRELPLAWPVARVVVLVPAVTLAVATAVGVQYALESGFLSTWFRLDGPGDGLLAVYLAEVWRGTGFVVVIAYFALARLPFGVIESARAAGAAPVDLLRRVWWPALAPAVAVAVTFRVLDTLRVVEGPVLATASDTFASHIWDDAFVSYEQGMASATSISLLAVVAVAGAVLYRVFWTGTAPVPGPIQEQNEMGPHPSIRSRLAGSAVAFVLGFAVANLALLDIPAPDHAFLLMMAAALIVTAGVGVIVADSRSSLSVWALLGVEFFLFFTLIPVLWLFTLATRPAGEVAQTLLPQEIRSEAFGDALDQVGSAMSHSLLAAAIATLIAIGVGFGAAYTLVRVRPEGHRTASLLVAALLLAPLLTWAVPAAHQMRMLSFVGSPFVTAVGYLIITVPLAIWLLIGVLRQASWDLYESAVAQGADHRDLWRSVLIPQLWPGVLATTILVFIAACLDFVVGAGLNATDGPLAPTLFAASGDPSTVAAAAFLWMLPMAVAVGLFASRITRLVGRS